MFCSIEMNQSLIHVKNNIQSTKTLNAVQNLKCKSYSHHVIRAQKNPPNKITKIPRNKTQRNCMSRQKIYIEAGICTTRYKVKSPRNTNSKACSSRKQKTNETKTYHTKTFSGGRTLSQSEKIPKNYEKEQNAKR